MRFLERYVIWYDKSATRGDLLLFGIGICALQLLLWYPFLWIVWTKL